MTLNDKINDVVAGLVGPDRDTQRKVRLFIGVAAIVLCATQVGPLIGHGIASLIGVAIFLVMLDTKGEGRS